MTNVFNMIRRFIFLSLLFLLSHMLNAQSGLPFQTIPAYPENYESWSVAARMIDGLGFRYYWATEGLSEKDLEFRPTDGARSTRETIEHIYSLTTFIYNTHFGMTNTGVSTADKPFEELRKQTLELLFEVRTFLVSQSPDLDGLEIKFPQGSLPYWNLINGPVSDALYHTGQVVMLRRMSGNPIRPGVDVLQGIIRN